jgi:hypothetical protein
MARQSQLRLASSEFGYTRGPSSCDSSADIAPAALRSFDCMQVVFCAAAAPGFAIGARASLRFDVPGIGLSGLRRRGSMAAQCPAVLAAPWGVASNSWRHYATQRLSCVSTAGVYSRPLRMSRGATPSHHSVAVCNEHFTSLAAAMRKQRSSPTTWRTDHVGPSTVFLSGFPVTVAMRQFQSSPRREPLDAVDGVSNS